MNAAAEVLDWCCPECGSTDWMFAEEPPDLRCICLECGHEWEDE